MSYTPKKYTAATSVQRILRTANNKIRIGDNPNDVMTLTDLDEYILDASRFIDGFLREVCLLNEIPLQDDYPEIQYVAPRYTAFLVYRDIYQAHRVENLPMGPIGWLEDAKDMLGIFKKNIDAGIYSTISSSLSGPSWETAEEFFQKKIGVDIVHDQIANVSDTTPLSGDNIGPYTDS